MEKGERFAIAGEGAIGVGGGRWDTEGGEGEEGCGGGLAALVQEGG